MKAEQKKRSIQEIIGKGYGQFWNSKQRYIVCKGSRASKKSTTAALKIIVRMMQYPEANTLVTRKVASTLKDSCYAKLKWATYRLGVNKWWKFRVSPLEMEYIPTGQKILFRGMDDETKITSITVAKGVLCWLWMEEAYEFTEDDFRFLNESIRGELPKGYYFQLILTFNPWDSSSWLKSRFFDVPRDNVLALSTTYKCNEWLSEADLAMFEEMKETDPERYKTAGLAEWGLPEGQFFTQWHSNLHVIKPFKLPAGWLRFRSMDWGSAHPYAVLWFVIDYDGNMYVYRELYGWGGKPNVGTGETAKQVGEKICKLERPGEEITNAVLDSACWAKTGVTGPTIAEEINHTLYEHNHKMFGKCSKGRAEMANQIKQRLIGNKQQDGTYKPALYVFSNCIHLIRTLPMLAHDKSNPEVYDTNGEDHLADALGYMCLARPWTPSRPVKPKPHDRWNDHLIDKDKPSVWTV